ncbi:MAG: hypothetical protein WAN43_14625 [Rhodomicrobium sp.]
MKLEWTYTALNYFDQLDRRDRDRIENALNGLPVIWDKVSAPQLQMLKGTPEPLWIFRASPEYRVILSVRHNRLIVEDIVRRSQIDALSRLSRTKAANIK